MRMIFDENDYFCWLINFVPENQKYSLLLRTLYEKEFTYILVMDSNRAEDGISLRLRFEYDNGYEPGSVTGYFRNRPCSILEMIVALALRCEETIMYDDRFGNRTGYWIHEMLSNMGLLSFDNGDFDPEAVDDILETFINRQYQRNGLGSLFAFGRSDIDVRSMEIWIQMNWYLNEYY